MATIKSSRRRSGSGGPLLMAQDHVAVLPQARRGVGREGATIRFTAEATPPITVAQASPAPQPARPSLLDEHRAAEQLGLSVKTLRRWRWVGRGPPFIKLGTAVRYA